MTLLACGADSAGVAGDIDASPAIDPGLDDLQLTLVGTYPLTTAADLAASAEHDLVAISEWIASGVSLIDVSDPENPTLYSRIENVENNADVQIKGDRLYVNHDRMGGGSQLAGLEIYDISDPANPVLTGWADPLLGHEGLQSCHNVWVQPDRELLYCASLYSGDVLVLSTGDSGVGAPDEPALVSAIPSPGANCLVPHDMYARGDRLYISWLCDGFAIYDISDVSAPVLIGSHNYPDSMNHNLWPTDSGEYLLSSDEVIGGHLRIWDIRDLDNIVQVGAFQPTPTAAIHNVEVAGDIAFISHYSAGLYVVDISDPSAPIEIDGDDFVDGPDVIDDRPITAFRGAWGVEPMLPYVYSSDMEGGLRIYRLAPVSGQ